MRSRHGSTIVGLTTFWMSDLVGVVRAERPLALAAERALQERAEDVRLHLAASHSRRLGAGARSSSCVKVDARGMLKQRPVDVSRRPRRARRRGAALAVEPLE